MENAFILDKSIRVRFVYRSTEGLRNSIRAVKQEDMVQRDEEIIRVLPDDERSVDVLMSMS